MFPRLFITGSFPIHLLSAGLRSQARQVAAQDTPAAPVRRVPPRHRTTWAPAGGGHAERARRVRQIQAGTLTAANGLTPTYAGDHP